jgi:hypothetical protein
MRYSLCILNCTGKSSGKVVHYFVINIEICLVKLYPTK